MKKHYIAPAAITHSLVVETPILSGSDGNNTEQDFGNGGTSGGEYKGDIGSDEGDEIIGI